MGRSRYDNMSKAKAEEEKKRKAAAQSRSGGLSATKTPMQALKAAANKPSSTPIKKEAGKKESALVSAVKKQQADKVASAEKKFANAKTKREKAAYSNELREAKYPLSAADSKLSTVEKDTIRRSKAQWERGQKLKEQGDTKNGQILQDTAHFLAESTRANQGYSGGATGSERIEPKLTGKDTLLSEESQKRIKASKANYALAQSLGDKKWMEASHKAAELEREAGMTPDRAEQLYTQAQTLLDRKQRYDRSGGRNGIGYTDAEAKKARETIATLEELYPDLSRSTLSRAGLTVKGGLENSAAALLNAAGWAVSPGINSWDEYGEAVRKGVKTFRSKDDGDWFSPTPLWNTANRNYQRADTLSQKGAADLSAAKYGLGKGGKFLVDAGAAATQMAPELLAGAATGGAGGLALLGARAFGGGAQEARQAGASWGKQGLYGAGSAAVEVATEKLFSAAKPFKKAYGSGTLDNAIEGAIGKLVKNKAAAELIASASTEGLEEVIADAVNPVIRALYNDKKIPENYREEDLRDWLYDGMIGGVLGGLGGVGGQVIGRQGAKRESAANTTDENAPAAAPEREVEETKIEPPTRSFPSEDKIHSENTGGSTSRPSTRSSTEESTEQPTPITEQKTEIATPKPEPERYSVGAAPGGFDPYSRMLNEHGAIEPGENPARMVDVPKSTDGNDKVRQTVRTLMEAEATPDGLVNLFQEGVVTGEWSYTPKKDKDSVERAERVIKDSGYTGAMDQWDSVVSGRRQVTKDDIVLAEMVYKAAAKAEDFATARKLAAEIAAFGTLAGQNVQAIRLLKKATPEGQLYYAQKGVDRLNNKLKDKYKGKWKDIEISDESTQALLNAATEEERLAAVDQIYEEVASQVPRTFGMRVDAWRYLSMLGNPRTHIRNVVGNIIMQAPTQGRNFLSSVIQTAALPKDQRTRSLTYSHAAYEFAQNDLANNKDLLQGSRYNESVENEIMQRVREKAWTVDKNTKARSFLRKLENVAMKPVQSLSSVNSKALDLEDFAFKKITYINSLANFMTTRGLTPDMLEANPQLLEEARGHAIGDALEATFQDYSELASTLAQLESKNKATKVILGSLVPFKKTPINIAKRGFDYSPFGIAKGFIEMGTKVKRGEMTAAEAIDDLAAGLTGSGIMALGMFLASRDMVVGGGDEDEKQNNFDVAQGSQEYALKLEDLTYTIDWAAPSVIPLFLGVETYNAIRNIREQEYGPDSESSLFADLVGASGRLFEPMMNMTMISGITGAMTSAAYNKVNPLVGIASNTMQNYGGQFIPTLMGQFARTVDDTRRTTFYDRNSWVPKGLQQFIQKQENKIPGVSKRNPAYLDAWGREDVESSPLKRAAENFFSPGYISKSKTTDVDRELQRLYDLGEEGVLPKKPEQSAQVNDKYLTAEEYQTYAKTKGTEAYNAMESIIASEEYKKLSDADKASVMRRVFEYANNAGKASVGADESKFDNWYQVLKGARDTQGIKPSDYLIISARKTDINKEANPASDGQKTFDTAAMIDNFSGLTGDQKSYLKENLAKVDASSKYQQALNAGFSPKEAAENYKVVDGAKAYGDNDSMEEPEFERYMTKEMGISKGSTEYNKYLSAYGGKNWASVKKLIGDQTSSGHKGYTMSDTIFTKALNAGYSEKDAKDISIAKHIIGAEYGDKNGNANSKEIAAYVKDNYPKSEWRKMFGVIANSNWKNPF